MSTTLTPSKLKLICLNLSEEISKGDNFLCNKDVTVNVQPDDTCYIVKKDLFKDEYYVECLGRGCVDSPLKDMYDSFEALPKWMQEKIAKLVVINQKTEVPHIGVTMTQGLSWIIKN